jgi:hypothetical protein
MREKRRPRRDIMAGYAVGSGRALSQSQPNVARMTDAQYHGGHQLRTKE